MDNTFFYFTYVNINLNVKHPRSGPYPVFGVLYKCNYYIVRSSYIYSVHNCKYKDQSSSWLLLNLKLSQIADIYPNYVVDKF